MNLPACLTAALLLAVPALAQTPALPAAATNTPAAATNAPPAKTQAELDELAKAWPFPVGEEILYTVYWGIIPVARASVTTSWVDFEGRRLLCVHARAQSNRVIAQVYPVDDNLESLIDPATFLPVRFSKRMSEGRHKYDEEVRFDHAALKAHWKSFRKNKEKTYDIDADTRDLLCFLYWMRGRPFGENETLKTRVDTDEKIYDLTINTFTTEKVKISQYGKLDGLKCIPKAEFNGLFVRKGDMTVFVSRDPRAVMLKMVADTPFANVEILLKEVNGPGKDFWIVNKKK